ncbi:MAG: efflux RND transporter permease subunit [Bacteroidales bacterium]|nr:efflux RND transporter permease subunit [Bacteroidales bacterium]
MQFLINRKITIFMLFLGITILGVVSYKQLAVELLPDSELPQLYVSVSARSEVDPAYLESQAVVYVEGLLATVEGIEEMETRITTRSANIEVSFNQHINLNYTYLKLQERIKEANNTLGDDFTVSVSKVNTNTVSNNFMELQVRGSGGADRVRHIVEESIADELLNIDGIATVSVFGGRQRTIEVQLNQDECDALNLTTQRIASSITSNSNGRTYLGHVDDLQTRYYVYLTAEYKDVTDIENVVVANGPILLKDIANVYFGVQEETTISRINGKEAVSVSLVNDAQSNAIELSHRVIATIETLNERLRPLDIEMVVQTNSAESMEENINQIISLALTGGLLAVFILWVFLRNLRLVILVAFSIPISVYAAFNFFYAFGITLNSLTLVGMALAIGMLLDSSVVVLDNVYRLASKGLSADKAVVQGTSEVWRSIVASTLTTIVIFVPFIFTSNYMIRLLGVQVGTSIISTLLMSLLVALIFIPSLLHLFLKKFEASKDKTVFVESLNIRQRFMQIYTVILKTAIRHPAITIFSAIFLLVVSLMLALSVNINSLTTVEADQFNVYITMPSGSTLEATDIVTETFEESLIDILEIQDVTSRIQEGEAVVGITLKENFEKIAKRDIAAVKSEVERRAWQIRTADISLSESMASQSFSSNSSGSINFMRMLGIGENRERIVLKGRDFEVMQLVAEEIEYYLGEMENINSVWTSSSSNSPEAHLTFDQVMMAQYELTQQNVISSLNSANQASTGSMSSGASLTLKDETYDITITTETDDEETNNNNNNNRRGGSRASMSLNQLKETLVENASGAMYPLNNIAGVTLTSGKSTIRRVNQEKLIEIYYTFPSEAQESKTLLEAYRLEVDEFMDGYELPAGVAAEIVHEEDEYAEFKFLIFAAVLLIYMILASVFESVVMPFLLMLTIPLAAIGSLLGLVITGNSLLSANTLIGFLILLGVVVNNGIILVDYTNILRSRGYRRNRALMMAGYARIRPIMITSITTIIAMMPMAMGTSEYAGAVGAPFAVTVIGGLSFSTLLTLVFIPTIYVGLENALAWYRGLSRKMHLIHIAIFLVGLLLILRHVDGPYMKMLYAFLLFLLIPGVTYFAQTSLRSANSTLIGPDDPLHIVIGNLVKIYDRSGQVYREWQSGQKIRERLGLAKEFYTWRDFNNFIWQIPLLIFLIYFAFFFIKQKAWMFILAHIIYFFVLSLGDCFKSYLTNNGHPRAAKTLGKILFWVVPYIILYIFFKKWDSIGLVALVGIFWTLALVIYTISNYLYNNDININRIEGRFSNLRRGFYRTIKQIPVVGKRRVPFKALKGVSFEITTGMIGLLGPNGAGKSTFMRIITGILEQSYGKIWINGFDTQVYREELQYLIGFLPQEFGMYESMSPVQFLEYIGILKGLTDKQVRDERIEYVLKSVHMWEKKDDKIGSFSGGMKQRIGIALILLHLPRILVVDEPTAGLDPRERIRFRNLLVELSRDRIVIFSTHIIEDISSSCNQVVVINKGELKYFGNPRDMVEYAEGKIWQFYVTLEEFDAMPDKQMIIHHIQDGDRLRVRYVAGSKPTPDAVLVEPNLEDAYLCMLKGI